MTPFLFVSMFVCFYFCFLAPRWHPAGFVFCFQAPPLPIRLSSLAWHKYHLLLSVASCCCLRQHLEPFNWTGHLFCLHLQIGYRWCYILCHLIFYFQESKLIAMMFFFLGEALTLSFICKKSWNVIWCPTYLRKTMSKILIGHLVIISLVIAILANSNLGKKHANKQKQKQKKNSFFHFMKLFKVRTRTDFEHDI